VARLGSCISGAMLIVGMDARTGVNFSQALSHPRRMSSAPALRLRGDRYFSVIANCPACSRVRSETAVLATSFGSKCSVATVQ
jgi:hypothetical protein